MSQESPEKPKRRLKQPTKARLRELVAEQATMIERLQGELAAVRRPWWRRLTPNAGDNRRAERTSG